MKSRFTALSIVVGLCATLICGPTLRGQSVNFSVKNPTFQIEQVKTMGCWATALTMLRSWKEGKLLSIEDVLKSAGGPYLDMYNANIGLSPLDEPAFLTASKLKAEPPATYTPQAIETKLKLWGPLAVTTAHGSGKQVYVHMRVILGIAGDGTAKGTMLTIADPADGQNHIVSFDDFIAKTADLAKLDYGVGADVRPLIIHL
jgi:hypothetical protein